MLTHSSARCYSIAMFNRILILFCYNKLVAQLIAPMKMDLLFGCGSAFAYANGKQLGTTNDHTDYSGNRFKFKNINRLVLPFHLLRKSK